MAEMAAGKFGFHLRYRSANHRHHHHHHHHRRRHHHHNHHLHYYNTIIPLFMCSPFVVEMDTPLVVRDALKTELLSVLMIRYKKIKQILKNLKNIVVSMLGVAMVWRPGH